MKSCMFDFIIFSYNEIFNRFVKVTFVQENLLQNKEMTQYPVFHHRIFFRLIASSSN